MRSAKPDPFGAIRNGHGKGIPKTKLPIGTIVIRSDQVNGRQLEYRLVKVKMDGPSSYRFVSYARWWWEKNKGLVPKGQLVLHADGDLMNDDPSNFILGTSGMKLVIAHRKSKAWSKWQHEKAAKATAEDNRRRGRINRSQNFIPRSWYPVLDDLGIIINVPFRRRKRVLSAFGANVSGYPRNGHGKHVGSVVQRALAQTRVRPTPSGDLALRRYGTYCLVEPLTEAVTGPISMSAPRLVAHLDQIGILAPAKVWAKKDTRQRK